MYDGINRSYFYYLPTNYNPSVAAPLILNLHGHTSNNSQQEMYSNFKPIADTAGFIMVYPQGTNSVYSGAPFWNYNIWQETVDDLGFLNALIDTVSSHVNIDPSRVYCTGMSNGGFMSYYMALYSNKFAAVASVTGSMAKSENGSPAIPIPVMQIHGTADIVVPYNGDITMRPIEETVGKWVTWNQCNSTPTITPVPDINISDNATAEHYVYTGGIHGNTVEFYKITNGGHTWPGSPIPLITNGNTCMDFSASKEIWRFFSQYSRPDLALELTKETPLNIQIYPNPANEELWISSEGTSFKGEIYSLQGELVSSFETKNTIHKTDVSHLESGVYVVQLKVGEQVIEKKLVITH
ncbi:MAG: T9SS type A sorting domain-containing protein [Brumimicrobium sp.]|nr:T9SS type A sorting domain-containing protein [Brumimicrobium sp.]